MKSGALTGHRLKLLESGAEYFPAIIAEINLAQREILLETYIFERDTTGIAVAAALRAAALRGVQVRLVVDGFGARNFAQDFLPDFIADGVQALIYRRIIRLFSLGRSRLRRLHRKLVVIDGRVGFVGGINIIDDMDTPGQVPPRVDFAVRIEGPLVVRIHASMQHVWRLVSWARFKRRLLHLQWVRPVRARVGRVCANFLVRDNLAHRRDIENAYLQALHAAKSEVLLANAYFFPGRAFRRALVDAAQRGVKVTVLLQGRVEYWLLFHACRVLYPHLLESGVRIIEYRKSFLHAKVAVIDQDWATVGSSNIDPFSLLLAREANLVIHDVGFARELRQRLERVIAEGGVELTLAHWQRQSLWRRCVSWFAYGTVRAAMGLAGYGGKHIL